MTWTWCNTSTYFLFFLPPSLSLKHGGKMETEPVQPDFQTDGSLSAGWKDQCTDIKWDIRISNLDSSPDMEKDADGSCLNFRVQTCRLMWRIHQYKSQKFLGSKDRWQEFALLALCDDVLGIAWCWLHWNDVWEDPLFGKIRGENELSVRGPERGSWLGFCFAVWLVLCLVGVLVLLVAFLPSEPNYLLVSPIAITADVWPWRKSLTGRTRAKKTIDHWNSTRCSLIKGICAGNCAATLVEHRFVYGN